MNETLTDAPTEPGLRAVDHYIAFWNAATPQDQQRLAAQAFADGVSSRVAIGLLRGVPELIDFRDKFAQFSPDYVFRARQQPEAHHHRARLQWELLSGGERFATGTDVLEIDASGRIAAITGFLDEAPEGFHDHDHE